MVQVTSSHKRQPALVDADKYAGGPCDLPTCKPCTWREMINYYYYLKTHNINNKKISVIMNKKMKHVWSVSYPTIPLRSDKKVTNLIIQIINKVAGINAKKVKTMNNVKL